MSEIGLKIENIPRLSPEEKAAAEPLATKAWAQSMELLAFKGKPFCRMPDDGESIPDETYHTLNIFDIEKLESMRKFKDEGIDLMIYLGKIAQPTNPYTSEAYDFYKANGRVIKHGGVSENPDRNIHEATPADLEQLTGILQKVLEKERKKFVVPLNIRREIEKLLSPK